MRKNNNNLKKGFCIGSSVLMAASAVSCSTENKKKSEKPNIVYIV